MRLWLVVTVAALAGSACVDPTGASHGACTQELRVRLSPRDTSVSVGRVFTPDVELTTCRGSVRLTDSYTWSAADPSVARFEPVLGRIRAVGIGTTTMEVTGRRYGPIGEIVVRVVP